MSAVSQTRSTRSPVSRAALREGLEALPTARLSGSSSRSGCRRYTRERLINARTRLINELRWQLHDLWPDWQIPKRALVGSVTRSV